MSTFSDLSSITSVEFLQAQVGKDFQGFLPIFVLPSKRTHYYDSSQWDDISSMIMKLKRVNDVYGVVSTQEKRLPSHQRGSSDTAVQVSSFVIDVDFASKQGATKPYVRGPEQAAAIRAKLPIQPSAVILTGNGEHWHFLLDKPFIIGNKEDLQYIKRLTREFHRLVQALFQQHGAEIDSISDINRAFRIPGTFNHKGGANKPVQLLAFEPDRRSSLEEIEALIGPAKPSKRKRARRPSDGIGRADHKSILQGCSWYRFVTGDGAASCSEPDWHAAAGVTACCEDGEEIFHEYSRQYPGYS